MEINYFINVINVIFRKIIEISVVVWFFCVGIVSIIMIVICIVYMIDR